MPEEYDDWDAPGNKERIIEVHHVDGNPANCEDDNLQPLCKPCHMRRHRIMRAQRRVSAEDSAGQRSMMEYGWNSTVID